MSWARACICVLAALMAAPTAVGSDAPSYKIKRGDVEKLSRGMQETFAGLHYLLNGYQTRQFLGLAGDEERTEWIRVFWKQQDPTPTTPKNEMEIEHTIRVKLARQFYRSKKWPGWDKRGEVFIRYGPPDYRGKFWGEVTVKKMRPPREIWYYARHNMLMAFEDFGLQGEYIYAIDPLGPAEKISPELAEFLLYDTDKSLTSKIPEHLLEFYSAPIYSVGPQEVDDPERRVDYLLSRPQELAEGIDAIMDPDYLEMLPKDVAAIFEREQIREVANNFEAVLLETPASYPFNFDMEVLDFVFAIDQFKGGEASNRVDVELEVPVQIQSGGSAFEETFHAEVVVWDARYNEVSRKTRELVFRASPDVAAWENTLPTLVTMSLPAGYYRVAISVRGENSGKSGSFRTTFECEPFGRRLAVSDIVFARRIRQTDQPSIFNRGPLEVIPRPYRLYSRSVPMPIYFEIYNMTKDSRGVCTYTVEYKIVPHSDDKKGFWDRFGGETPIVSSKFQATSVSEYDTQYLSVRTDNLRRGSYDLLITLTDDLTQQVVYRRGTFSLVD